MGRRAAGPEWPGPPTSAARPPSWPRPGPRTRRPRCRSRACRPRTAPPGSRGLRRASGSRSALLPPVPGERLVVAPAGDVVHRAVGVRDPACRQFGHGTVDLRAPSEPPAQATVRRSAGRPRATRLAARPSGVRTKAASCGPHRRARDMGPGQVRPREGHGIGRGEATEQAVDRTRHRVGRHADERHPGETRRQSGREAGVPPTTTTTRGAGARRNRGRARRPRPSRHARPRWPTRRTDACCGESRGRGAGCRGTRASATSWPPAHGGSRRARSTPPGDPGRRGARAICSEGTM